MSAIQFRDDMTVRLVRSAATDADVLFAARVSTLGAGTDDTVGELGDRDRGLINYLMRDRHGSPFEHNSMTFYVEAPIFVFREFQRHRMASYNEESGRYKELEPVFYAPNADRALVQEGKPGAYRFYAGTLGQQRETLRAVKASSIQAYAWYTSLLGKGIAREVARMVLPLNIYSSMYVTLNSRSLMNFLSLRTKHEDASFPSFPQREIEMCAEQMEAIWATLMPVTHEVFTTNGRIAP